MQIMLGAGALFIHQPHAVAEPVKPEASGGRMMPVTYTHPKLPANSCRWFFAVL